jgi:sugar phosphate isomerase/epimerase
MRFKYGVRVDRATHGLELVLAPTLQPLGGEARDDLARIASMGFRAVQLSATQSGMRPRELDASARRGLRAALRRLELAPSGIDLWIPPEHFTDSEHIERAIDAVRSAVELAADLGRVPVSLTLPHSRDPATGGDASNSRTPAEHEASTSLDDAVAAIASHAERFGVELADHAIPNSSHLGHDRALGWGIDPAAWLARGENPARIVTQSHRTDHLVSARLADMLHSGMRGPPGEGPDHRLDTLAYRVALSVAGYRRPVVLDARQWPDVMGGLRESASHWRDLAAQLP